MERPHPYPAYLSTLLQEVKQFDYLGLRLDPMVNMKAAVSFIQEKANKVHSLVLAIALLSETGIPPLNITQICNLHKLDSGCTPSPPTTIQRFLLCLWLPLLQAVPLDTLEDRMQNAVGQVNPPRRYLKSPMPHNVTLAKLQNKEKSYKK